VLFRSILLTIISVSVPVILGWGMNAFSKYLSAKTQNAKVQQH
jgi:hypothetical protein